MSHRYLEIIIPTRQFILLIAAVVCLIAGAFMLGLLVRVAEPPALGPGGSPTAGVSAAAPVLATPVPEPLGGVVTPTPFIAASVVGTAEPREAWATPEPVAQAGVAPVSPTEVVPLSATPRPVATATRKPASATPVPTAPTPAPAPSRGVPAKVHPWVQVAAVSRQDVAEDLRQRLVKFGFTGSQVTIQQGSKGLFHVRVGPFTDLESAGRVAARLGESGFKGAYPVKE